MEDLHLSISSTKLSKFTILDLAKVISVHLLFQLPVSYLGTFPVFFIKQIQMLRRFHLNFQRNKKRPIDRYRPAFRHARLPTFALDYPFSANFVPLELSSDYFWDSNYPFFILSIFIENRGEIRHFNLGCPRWSYLFTAHPRMLSRANCAIFSRIILCTMIETIPFARSTKTFELPWFHNCLTCA